MVNATLPTWLDLGVLALFLLFLIRGFYRGAVREIVMILGIPVAVALSVALAPALRPMVYSLFGVSKWAHLLVYPVLFVLLVGALRVLAEVVARLLQWTGVGLFDRLLGLMLGAVEGLLIAGGIGAVLQATPPGARIVAQTHVLKYLVPLLRTAVRIGKTLVGP